MNLSRHYIRNHPAMTIVYGESYLSEFDYDKYAEMCRGEINCFPVHVCMCFDRKEPWFDQHLFEPMKDLIHKDVLEIPKNNPIYIVPEIGQGKSQMKAKTPELYDFMILTLQTLLPKDTTIWL